MNDIRRAARPLGLAAVLLAAALFGLRGTHRAPVVQAAPAALPAQQGVQASGFVTFGNGT